MAPTIVLISGANRGIGKGLLGLYLARPNHIVIAGNRNPSHPTSIALHDLPKGPNARLIIVKIDALSESDPSEAMRKLATEDGINHLDIVIANAAVCFAWPTVKELRIEDLKGHMEPNVYGVVRLFQATLPFLLRAENPKWATMGSEGGVIENQPPIRNSAYAPTKVAIHWLTKKINQEEEKLIAFVLDPGWCPTDMGNALGHGVGLGDGIINIEDSTRGMVAILDRADKLGYGGKLWSWNGTRMAW